MPVTHGVTGSSPVHTAKSFVGTLTEWLGGGLQNRIQQFESAGYLHKVIHIPVNHFFWYARHERCLTGASPE